MILVDTSVWVEISRRRSYDLQEAVQGEEIVTCLPVIHEFLQGIGDERAYRVAHDAMFALRILDEPMTRDVYVEAAQIYRAGRRQGLTIRSTIDCLIAAIAIRHAVPLLHADRDFVSILQFTPLESRFADFGRFSP